MTMHHTPSIDAATPVANPYAFDGKSKRTITGSLSTTVRVWPDSPHMATVPSLDEDGKRFECVFVDHRKTLFDAYVADKLAAGDTPRFVATGFWRKRMWKKTKTGGGWGTTWQFVVAEMDVSFSDESGILFGDVPDTLVDPLAGLPALPGMDDPDADGPQAA